MMPTKISSESSRMPKDLENVLDSLEKASKVLCRHLAVNSGDPSTALYFADAIQHCHAARNLLLNGSFRPMKNNLAKLAEYKHRKFKTKRSNVPHRAAA